jgi:hypothetical protein
VIEWPRSMRVIEIDTPIEIDAPIEINTPIDIDTPIEIVRADVSSAVRVKDPTNRGAPPCPYCGGRVFNFAYVDERRKTLASCASQHCRQMFRFDPATRELTDMCRKL